MASNSRSTINLGPKGGQNMDMSAKEGVDEDCLYCDKMLGVAYLQEAWSNDIHIVKNAQQNTSTMYRRYIENIPSSHSTKANSFITAPSLGASYNSAPYSKEEHHHESDVSQKPCLWGGGERYNRHNAPPHENVMLFRNHFNRGDGFEDTKVHCHTRHKNNDHLDYNSKNTKRCSSSNIIFSHSEPDRKCIHDCPCLRGDFSPGRPCIQPEDRSISVNTDNSLKHQVTIINDECTSINPEHPDSNEELQNTDFGDNDRTTGSGYATKQCNQKLDTPVLDDCDLDNPEKTLHVPYPNNVKQQSKQDEPIKRNIYQNQNDPNSRGIVESVKNYLFPQKPFKFTCKEKLQAPDTNKLSEKVIRCASAIVSPKYFTRGSKSDVIISPKYFNTPVQNNDMSSHSRISTSPRRSNSPRRSKTPRMSNSPKRSTSPEYKQIKQQITTAIRSPNRNHSRNSNTKQLPENNPPTDQLARKISETSITLGSSLHISDIRLEENRCQNHNSTSRPLEFVSRIPRRKATGCQNKDPPCKSPTTSSPGKIHLDLDRAATSPNGYDRHGDRSPRSSKSSNLRRHFSRKN